MTRVRRLSDGKIFSSPQGVAMNADEPIAKAVYYCCRGYLESVEGIAYEWAYDEDEDRGRRKLAGTYWARRGRWKTRGWVLKWRAKFIKAWLDNADDLDRWRRSSELAHEIGIAVDRIDEPYKWKPSPTALSKHLHAYLEFYEKVFGLREYNAKTPMYTGRMFKFIRTLADPEYDIVLAELASGENLGRGKPVIRMNDMARFESMAEAERLTGVPYYHIIHCCEDDIPHCLVPLTGEKMEFKYATEVDNQ